jgi:tRNA (Thr-GGU) A37 N-methylase
MTDTSLPSSHLRVVGHVRSTLQSVGDAPRQGSEGAPDAWIEVHRVRIHDICETRLHVGPLEAIDGTPVVDIQPVRHDSADC